MRLDDVSKAVLGDSIEGIGEKYKGLTGKDIQTLPPEEQKKYVLKDAELVTELYPMLPIVVSCNCGGGDEDNVRSSFSISSENKMGDIQLTYRYHGIQL